MRRAALLATAIVACGAIVSSVSGAESAFPGKNGKIVFDGPGLGIWTAEADGSNAKLLVPFAPGAGPSGARFAADGKTFVYRVVGLPKAETLWLASTDGHKPRQVVAGQLGHSPGFYGYSISPDGSRVAFSQRVGNGDRDIFVVNADGSGLVNITNTPSRGELEPDWSPDGRMIAFVTSIGFARSIDDTSCGGNDELVVVDAGGQGARSLTSDDICQFTGRWSPDGSRILVHQAGLGFNPSRNEVAIVAVDGSTPQPVGIPGLRTAGLAVWSPDGQSFLIGSTVYPITGGGGTKLAFEGIATDWAPAPLVKPKPKAKKPPLCKKGQKPTKKKPCRRRR